MCRSSNTSQTWTLSNWFHSALWVCWSLQFLQTWEIPCVICGSGRTRLCLERKIESRVAVMKVMFSLAEPRKWPQRGCSGMCLAKGVRGRVQNWAQLPVVKVKIALEILLIFQQYKVEQQVLYKSSRTPDPCVEVNHYIVPALELASLLIGWWKKVVLKEEEILQASDSFLPCYLLGSDEQRCFSSTVRMLKFTKLSS